MYWLAVTSLCPLSCLDSTQTGVSMLCAINPRKRIVSNTNFDLMCWEGMDSVIHTYHQIFRVWVMKHISQGSVGQNANFHKKQTLQTSEVSSCGLVDESTSHVMHCINSCGRCMFPELTHILISGCRRLALTLTLLKQSKGLTKLQRSSNGFPPLLCVTSF